MRFRVVLVDDRPKALEDLRVHFPWAAYGLVVEGAFTDPAEAYEALCRNPPDAVFAAIRMPDMDGIALLERLREEGVCATFVMISGHTAFDYAQKALRLGAMGYLTEPLEPDAVESTLAALQKKLTDERLAQGALAVDMLYSRTAAKWLGVRDKASAGWVAAFVRGDVDRARDWAERMASGGWWRAYAVEQNRSLLLWHVEEAVAEAIRSAGPDAEREMTGVSGFVRQSEEMPVVLREAYLAYRQPYIDPEARFCAFARRREDQVLSLVLMTQNRISGKEELQAFFGGLPDTFREHGLQVIHAEQLWNYCAAVSSVPVDTHTAEALLVQFRSLDEECAYLGELAGAALRERNEDNTKRPGNEHFAQMLGEVEAHFDQPLSLRTLSAKYYLNLSYASELFRRATGMTFTEYVTKLRMTRAVALMEQGLELQAVARQVGYEDYFYFSKVFKKSFGLPPTQYHTRVE